MNVIEFNHVWKKFRKGEKFNSLRDAIPNFFSNFKNKNGINGNLKNNKDFWALRDVNFEVKRNEVLGVIGPNGAGKSTILKLLSKIMEPTKGKIEIRGRLSALIEVGAGFHDDLTGKENIYLNGTILGMRKKEIDTKFEEIVEFSGIREFIDTPVKRYSSGMHARLGFSVAAHMDPDVLIVDEVLAVGDMAFQAKCAQKMRELLNTGATIVLVSHNLSLIQNMCKRVILLDKGETVKEGSPDGVIPYYQNIVYRKSEEELKRKFISTSYEVKPNAETLVKILNVSLFDGQYNSKENFQIGESISLEIEYESKGKIENPIFSLDIIRADGVLCCSSNTADNGFSMPNIQNKGKVRVELGKISLAPGVYIAKTGIWDKDLIHPYASSDKAIFKIQNPAEMSIKGNAVISMPAIWSKKE
ncbi:MAG: ABC transporter ATP-binding protein [Candidatus Omnitrophota bacterium]